MNHIIIQAHGFNSGPGQKKDQLELAFPNAKVYAPQLPYYPMDALSILTKVINEHKDDYIQFVGTSLGAFYGLILAADHHSDRHQYYLINTALQPHLILSEIVNTTITNYKTFQRQFINEAMIEDFKRAFRIMSARMNGKAIDRIQFFEGSMDEVVDHNDMRSFLKSFETKFNISTHPQDHRFADLAPVISAMHGDGQQVLSTQ